MRKSLAIIIGFFLALTSLTAIADYTVDMGRIRAKTAQDIVLTLSEDPTMKPEVACLVLTMGQFLRASSPKVNVTVFLKNDGVKLADSATIGTVPDMCQISPDEFKTLEENLEAFIDGNDNNLVNCPICWGAHFGVQIPDYGILDSNAIPPLLLGADKVIDF
jgi:hypothetical protein